MDERELRYVRRKAMRSAISSFSELFLKLLVFILPAVGLTFAIASIDLGVRGNPTSEESVAKLQQQITELNQKYDVIQQTLNKAPTDMPMSKLLLRLATVEAQQDAIAQTILIDPDKALTARLLREQQQNLDAKLTKTQDDQTALNNKIDNITTAVVAIPLIGFVLSLLSAIIIYFYSKFKTKEDRQNDR